MALVAQIGVVAQIRKAADAIQLQLADIVGRIRGRMIFGQEHGLDALAVKNIHQ